VKRQITDRSLEALSLLNEPFTIANLDDAKALTSKLRRKLGCSAVLLKGGHIDTVPSNDVVADILDDGKEVTVFTTRRLKTKNTHGTGCTLSAAIAASVARGSASLVDAVRQAKEYIQGAIETSIGIGSGHGCLHHMWQHNSCPLKPELRSQQVPTETVTACDWLWEAANVGALLEKIVNHPFIQGLRNGGLNIDAFKRFVIQVRTMLI
jgi:pyridoxal/pyridoxine/pyridoxamine kinase